jgi:hypothetical protein
MDALVEHHYLDAVALEEATPGWRFQNRHRQKKGERFAEVIRPRQEVVLQGVGDAAHEAVPVTWLPGKEVLAFFFVRGDHLETGLPQTFHELAFRASALPDRPVGV